MLNDHLQIGVPNTSRFFSLKSLGCSITSITKHKKLKDDLQEKQDNYEDFWSTNLIIQTTFNLAIIKVIHY